MSRVSPVILFDGVCNLCHASVAWVIERDPGQIFRFASLQSAAARELLAGREVPDSVVLVDDDGLHIRSTAALRIARRLGFPWSLLSAGLLVPAFLRDGVYQFVARHRYRWFGRQDRCLMPTPELAARFLDANETIDVPPQAPPPPATKPGFFTLFLLAYLLVYIFPFPFSGVGPYDKFWNKVIQ